MKNLVAYAACCKKEIPGPSVGHGRSLSKFLPLSELRKSRCAKRYQGDICEEEPEIVLPDEIFYLRMDYEVDISADGCLTLKKKRKRTHGDLRNSHIH